MALLSLTTQDTQMLLMLKPYLTLSSQAWLDGLLTLALLTDRELREELSPLPVLQMLGLAHTRSRIQAEHARARALGLTKEGQYMPQPLDPKDVSLILAIKPFLSDKSQTLIDTLVNLLAVISGPPERKIDPEAVANLINLIAQANTPPPASQTEYQLPVGPAWPSVPGSDPTKDPFPVTDSDPAQ
ncbi:MAG TPA: hypothetical protein GXX69_08400 [Firmicutes bacterium]|nr:hypothetical protein [Bacillota bacterium]